MLDSVKLFACPNFESTVLFVFFLVLLQNVRLGYRSLQVRVQPEVAMVLFHVNPPARNSPGLQGCGAERFCALSLALSRAFKILGIWKPQKKKNQNQASRSILGKNCRTSTTECYTGAAAWNACADYDTPSEVTVGTWRLSRYRNILGAMKSFSEQRINLESTMDHTKSLLNSLC